MVKTPLSGFQEGHNIFGSMSSTDYKNALSLIKHCILATDLALFFKNKKLLAEILETTTFSFDKTDHRFDLFAK